MGYDGRDSNFYDGKNKNGVCVMSIYVLLENDNPILKVPLSSCSKDLDRKELESKSMWYNGTCFCIL